MTPADKNPADDRLKALFAQDALNDDQRRMLLSGRSGEGLAATGPVICACFGVGLNLIRQAIVAQVFHQFFSVSRWVLVGLVVGSVEVVSQAVDRRRADDYLNRLARDRACKQVGAVFHDPHQVHRQHFERHLAGTDLGEIQQVIDYFQQDLPR